MARKGSNGICKRIGDNWYENFTTIDGQRHRKTLNTSDYSTAFAEAGRRQERHNLIVRGVLSPETARQAITLAEAYDWYLERHGNKMESRRRNAERARSLLEKHLGSACLLTEISNVKLHRYTAWRLTHHVKRQRGGLVPIKARTINLELTSLRAVLNMAGEDLQANLPTINWCGKRGVAGVLLQEAKPPRTIIPSHEAEADLREFMSEDLRDLFDFAIATTKRFSEIANLRWCDVDRAEGTIRIDIGKSRGREQKLPLAGVADLLDRVAGQHPEFVFSWVCRRGGHQHTGARYPWTSWRLRDRWNEARSLAVEAGILPYITWHRATRATGITRTKLAEGESLAQDLASHASAETTRMYYGGEAIDLGRPLQRAQEARAAAAHRGPKVVAIRKGAAS